MDNTVTNAVANAVGDVATNDLAATSVAGGLNGTVFNGLDLAVIIAFAVGMLITIWFSMRKKNESGKDYFLSGPRRQLAADRLLDLLLQHRFRASRGSGRRGFCHRHGHGPLGNARVLDSSYWAGLSCRSMTA